MEKRLNLQMGNIEWIFIEIFQNKSTVGLKYAPNPPPPPPHPPQEFQYLHKN